MAEGCAEGGSVEESRTEIMSRCFLLLVLGSFTWASTIQVQIRKSEVWLVRDGTAKQLTSDNKAKSDAILSPAEDLVAYYNECPVQEHCTPSVVILDLEGQKIREFDPTGKAEAAADVGPCASVSRIWWAKPGSIAAECHINPSLSEYIETDVRSGQTTRDLLGYWFSPSPDGKQVAHAGWIPHFAPPFAHSNYLQIDDLTIYPLPEGTHPEQDELPPHEPARRGLTYSGIHEFETSPEWSPDMKRIGLIDCSYDWTADSTELTTGTESNRRCWIVVIATTGGFELIPIEGDSFYGVRLQWIDSQQLALLANGERKRIVHIPIGQDGAQ